MTTFLNLKNDLDRYKFIQENKGFIDKVINQEVIKTVLFDGGILPTRKHSDDLGLDIYAIEDYDLMPNTGYRFRTGIKMEVSGILKDKSSSAWYKDTGRYVIVCGGVIDPQYRGEILVVLFNLGQTIFEVRKGKSFVQLIAKGIPVQVSELDNTERGEKGFGTGE